MKLIKAYIRHRKVEDVYKKTKGHVNQIVSIKFSHRSCCINGSEFCNALE